MEQITALCRAMMTDYAGDPRRIQHFLKVHALARLIGLGEELEENLQFTLEAAALVHDIGIHRCEALYGRCSGPLQEREGPALAQAMLEELGFDEPVIRRVCWLVGHHHTYAPIEGTDHQILVEADFLVNLYEDGIRQEGVQTAYDRIFRTRTGRQLCRQMFGLTERP